jgi:hypothetical protein
VVQYRIQYRAREQHNKLSDSIILSSEFLGHLSNYNLLKNYSASWSLFFVRTTDVTRSPPFGTWGSFTIINCRQAYGQLQWYKADGIHIFITIWNISTKIEGNTERDAIASKHFNLSIRG